jgi:hypothetical protein
MQIRPAFADGRHVRMGGNGLSPFFATLLCGKDGLGLNTLPIQRMPDNDMTTFSGFARFSGRQSTQRGALWLALVLGAAMFAAGCGKGKSAAPAASATPPPQTNQAAVQPVSTSPADNSPPAPAAPVANASTTGPNMQELNRALIGYIVHNHHRPKTFEEFAASGTIQIPPPPAGKKYTLNPRGYIILVDSSTK